MTRPVPLPLFLLLVGAAFLRTLAVTSYGIDWDESWVGNAAMDVLRGTFPPFFYGQPFMGSIESYLHAVVFAVIGVSPPALKVAPVLVGIAFVYLVFVLTLRIVPADRPTAYLAALWAAFPSPGALAWSDNARLHYSLAPLLGALLLLIGLRVVGRREQPTPAASLLLGILSGLNWWNNYIGVIFVGAVWVVVAARFRRTLVEGLPWAASGFLLGSLPLWLYNLQSGVLFNAPRGTWAPGRYFAGHFWDYVKTVLPWLAGIPPQEVPTPFGTVRAVVAGLALGVGLTVTAARALRGEPGAGMMALVVLNMTLLATLSVYGGELPMRYIFPLLAVLPTLFGVGFATLGRWGRPGAILAWGLAGGLAVANTWAARAEYPTIIPAPTRARAEQARSAEERLFQTLRALGLTHVYTETDELTLAGKGAFVFSYPFEDPHPPYAAAVDGSAAIGYLVRESTARRIDAGLLALDARYAVEPLPPWRLYHRFSLPQLAYEEILPAAWSAPTNDAARPASHAFDRDIETMWAAAAEGPDRSYILDLRRIETVGMVAWIPGSYRETPAGIEVAASVDGVNWRTLVRASGYQSPVYWSGTHPFLRLRRPRIEVRCRPTPARFIRLAPLEDGPWSIREIFVYAPAPTAPAPDPLQVDGLAGALLQKGVSRIYADHWVLARLNRVAEGRLPILPVEIYVDNHGRSDLYRGWRHPPDYSRLDRLVLGRTVAVVIEGWLGTSAAFERTVRETGYTFQRELRGDYLVYTDFEAPSQPSRPLPRAQWRASASVASDTAALALDGVVSTRWTTVGHAVQTPGLWFDVDLGAPTSIGAIELGFGSSRHDYPRGLELSMSLDGSRWDTVAPGVIASGPLYWTGTHALGGGVERLRLQFPARSVQFVRLTQTGADPLFAWSIHELDIYP